MKNEELKYVNYQLIVIFITILAEFISLFITYNQKRALQKKPKIIEPKTLFIITLINCFIFFITGTLFLLINIKLYEISKQENENLKTYELQIIASILTVISQLIAIYVTTKSSKGQISDIENPNI